MINFKKNKKTVQKIFSIVNTWDCKVVTFLDFKIKIPFKYFYGLIANGLRKILGIVNNKIVFSNYMGESYGGNSKYITEEILNRKLPFELVWLLKDTKNNNVPKGVKPVKYGSLKAFFELATAKIWIDNYHKIDYIKKGLDKNSQQIYIQTWHGSLGIKKIEKSVFNLTSDSMWEKYAIENSKMTNFWISNSLFETNVYKNSFWDVKNIKEFGHPQNDIFFKTHEGLKDNICRTYNISTDKKILLYAPTFRDSLSFDPYDINFEILEDALKRKFDGNWCIMVRFHNRLRKRMKNSYQNNRIINVSNYHDMQELLYVADILISDYSSCMFDFMLTKKPVFIFAVDIEKYSEERGFYYPLETTPFSIARNNKELITNVNNFDIVKYKSEVEQFLKDKGCMEDGQASKRVVDLIEKIIG